MQTVFSREITLHFKSYFFSLLITVFILFPYGVRIYIPLSLPLKEWIRVRTKLVAGELFTFRDRQDSCLPSAARLDSPGDQGKGKVSPRKILFLQDFSFLSG